MQTIYQIVEEVCARDFKILARLSETQQKKFINIIYEDVLAGDNLLWQSNLQFFNLVIKLLRI